MLSAMRNGLFVVAAVLALPYALTQDASGQNMSNALPSEPPAVLPAECELMDLAICEDMPWNYTLYPNFRHHTNQLEAEMELEQFRKLIEVNCSGAIVHFLCAIYAPFCTDDHPLRVFRPCRRLCQHVRDGCEPVFNQQAQGLPWPDHLNCDNYDDGTFCFGPSQEEIQELTIPPTLLRPTDPTVSNGSVTPPTDGSPPTHNGSVTTPSTSVLTPTEPSTIAPAKCELMDLAICEDMPWNYTLYPNFRLHTNQVEAEMELEQFRKLIEVNCSGAIVHFLCAIYAPFCTDDHPLRVFRPCRRLCQHVRDGCEPVFNQQAQGLPWPDHLNCDNYDDGTFCFGPSQEEIQELTIPPTLLRPTDPTVSNGSVTPPTNASVTTPSTSVLTPTEPPTIAPAKCEFINLEICKDMPWNSTLYPNFRNHTSQVEARSELEQFRNLIEIDCSGAIVHFLCAIYAPFCTDDHPLRVFRPCRRLCQHVRDGCEPVFNQKTQGLPWPDHLNCDNYDDGTFCFGPSQEEIQELTIPPTLLTVPTTDPTESNSSVTPPTNGSVTTPSYSTSIVAPTTRSAISKGSPSTAVLMPTRPTISVTPPIATIPPASEPTVTMDQKNITSSSAVMSTINNYFLPSILIFFTTFLTFSI